MDARLCFYRGMEISLRISKDFFGNKPEIQKLHENTAC